MKGIVYLYYARRNIKATFSDYFGEPCENITQLPQAGSDRIYYRLTSISTSAIGTYGRDTKENETFIHHTKHFQQQHIAVPQVYSISNDKQYYLQQDLGDVHCLPSSRMKEYQIM